MVSVTSKLEEWVLHWLTTRAGLTTGEEALAGDVDEGGMISLLRQGEVCSQVHAPRKVLPEIEYRCLIRLFLRMVIAIAAEEAVGYPSLVRISAHPSSRRTQSRRGRFIGSW